MSTPQPEAVLRYIVTKMMKERNIENYKFNIDGGTGKADGYVGEIVFFHIIINNKRLHFILKSEKPHKYLKNIGLDVLNARELEMYTKVFPALKEFTTRKKWTELSNFIPKFWFAEKHSDRVNIVLENLKYQNFHIHERKPIDFNHMKLLFETFGKWHATSLAFRDQNPEKFQEMVRDWPDPRLKLIKNFGLVKQFTKEMAVIRKMLMERERCDLVGIYKSFEDQMEDILFRRNSNEKDMLMISHGDNWIANYMFKYELNTEKPTPNQVYLIDFQFSRLDSPAVELSSTLYNMGDKSTFEKFEDLLLIYHKSLSNTLKSLGSDPNDLITMEDLKRQWKKYGIFSALNALCYLRVMLCDDEEAPNLGDVAEKGASFDGIFGFQMKCMDIFWEKALDVFIHYGEFLKQYSNLSN